MLILSRKLNESIIIDGRIVVKVLRIDKDTVKLGIQAPAEVTVHREEIEEIIQKKKNDAANGVNGVNGPKPQGKSDSPSNGP